MTITIENANKELLAVVRNAAKLANAQVRVKKMSKKENAIQKALREIENGECETYANFEEFKTAMMNEIQN